MPARQPPRPGFLDAARAALAKLWAQVLQAIQRRGEARALPEASARPAPRGSTDFTAERPKRAPVSLGESPTAAAEKSREGAGAVTHVGEQAVVGSQRARQLLMEVQHSPPTRERPKPVEANGPKAKIPPGPFRP